MSRQIELREGDQIMMKANDKKSKLFNSEILTFSKLLKSGAVSTQEGKTIPAGMLNFTHGYVVTSHKSQGQTREAGSAIGGFDAKALYVSSTRSKRSMKIYTTSKANLFRSANASGSRESAIEATTFDHMKNTPEDPISHHELTNLCREVVDARLAQLRKTTSSSDGVSKLTDAEVEKLKGIANPYTKLELDNAARPRLERLRSDVDSFSTLTNQQRQELLARVAALSGDEATVSKLNEARRQMGQTNRPTHPPQLPSEADELREKSARHVSEPVIAAASSAQAEIARLRASGDRKSAESLERSSLLTRINATRISDGKSPLSKRDLREIRRDPTPARKIGEKVKTALSELSAKIKRPNGSKRRRPVRRPVENRKPSKIKST